MSKLFLIFFSVLAIAAIVSAWDNDEDTSLSKELAPSRLVRSADILTDTTTGPADTATTTTTTSTGFLFNFLSLSVGIFPCTPLSLDLVIIDKIDYDDY